MSLISEIPGIAAGSGTTATLGYFFIRGMISEKIELKKEKKELVQQLKDSDARERKNNNKVIEALILNKIFLESHEGELSGLGETVKDEMRKHALILQSISNELSRGPDSDS